MSYILDALRRSEQQRQRAAEPSLNRMLAVEEFGEERSFLPYGIAAVVLIAGVVVIGWLRPWQHHDPAGSAPVAQTDLAPQPPDAPPAPDTAVPQVAEASRAPSVSVTPAAASPETVVARVDPEVEHKVEKKIEELHVMQVRPYKPTRDPEETVPEPAAAQQHAAKATAAPASAPASAPAPAVVQAAPPPAVAATAASPEPGTAEVLALDKLPRDIQQEIPPMTIAGYTYSNTPRERNVAINDRLFQEGQQVADGLTLTEITRDGLIFSYKGYRFRRGLQ